MRIPFPERISLPLTFAFATVLAGVQQLQGTNLLFSLYSFLFIIVAVVAFNLSGGFTRTTGGYVFFYAFGVVVGLVGKAYFGEAADTNLLTPNLTILVFLGGIFAMLVAVFITQKLRRRKALLLNAVQIKDTQNAVIGCVVTGLAIQLLVFISPNQSGTFLSALNQINRFLPLAVILGTLHQIRKTNGRSCINWTILLAGGTMFIANGLIGFSKEGLFLPVVCWLFSAASLRFRFKLYQAALLFLGGFILLHYFVPYAQIGRSVPTESDAPTTSDKAHVAFQLLSNLGQVRQDYTDQQASMDADASGYYNAPHGLLDRLEIISPDDRLIDTTETYKPFGLSPIPLLFLNLIPHVLYPGKPTLAYGNLYAHEVGNMIADDDFTTGISFTPTGDAYHMAKWVGVLLVAPLIWIMLFTLFESLCGDVRESPWGLLVIAMYSHGAPEGMLGGPIYMMGFTSIGLLFAAYTCSRVMPVIGTLLFGPEKTGLRRRRAALQSLPAESRV